MRKLLLFGLVAVLGVLGISAVALASRSHDKGNAKDFSAKLNGWEEDPSQVTTGKGSFRAHVDSATQISFTLKYRNLEGPAFMAHIHIGGRSESGGISAWLCGPPPPGTATQPLCPPGQTTEAVVNGTIQADDITGPAGQGVEPGNFADLLRAVRKGETYTNVHTGTFGPPSGGRAPGGEIRGQNKANKGHDDDDDHDGGKHKRHR
jgi:CHRD domain